MDANPTTISRELTAQEVSTASDYLVLTRDRLLHALTGLCDAQWNYRPDVESWSILDILEHLALLEGTAHGVVRMLPDAMAAGDDRVNSEIEAIILAKVPDRSEKIKAPPQVSPTGQMTPQECLKTFVERRARTIELLRESASLRGRVIPHPVHGPWDGYQWMLALAAHCRRHTDQIAEWQASANYPSR